MAGDFSLVEQELEDVAPGVVRRSAHSENRSLVLTLFAYLYIFFPTTFNASR